MPVKYLAITIAGAVSLGSYEAGATYEILDAIRQHNENPETIENGDFIRIDVLTGASAGGMTASILAQKLLYAKNLFVGRDGKSSPYDNPLYNTWVKGIDLQGLLDTVDKPLPDGDPALLSLLSSNLIEKISQNTLAQFDSTGSIPLDGGAHNAIDPVRGIRLGLALTNLNGVNYQYTMFGGDPFCYTDFSDQMIRRLPADDRSGGRWKEISEAAVACGAFPIAFRTKDLARDIADYQPSDTLVPFPTNPYTFTYSDGGVLQNQPLGMAKNLVDENDHHIANDNRFYLFVSPSPMDGKQDLGLHEAGADMIQVPKRLFEVYTGQSTFHDWIQAQEINQQIDLLDQRATGLAHALQNDQIDPSSLTEASQQILALLYGTDPGGENQAQALDRLAVQYAEEVGKPGATEGLGGPGSTKGNAFLSGILALEKAANLGERDRMQIYGIVTKDGFLAGAGVCAFLGFFDIQYRDHDYDWGRTVAQKLLGNPAFSLAGQLGPIRYTPAPIRPIDGTLAGLHLRQVPKADVETLKEGLTARINEILKDMLSNPLERYPAQLGGDLILKLLIDWEFSRNTQE
jgi:predicted acylesterase/phospholipase RssA